MVVKTKRISTVKEQTYNIISQAKFSQDGKHRYLLSYQWDDKKPTVLVVTNFPGMSNGLVSDLTTGLVINNVADDFGSVEMVNLFSLIGGLNDKITDEAGFTKATDQVILLEANKVDMIVIATGAYGINDKFGKKRQLDLIQQLTTAGLDSKIKWLVSDQGKPVHPLSTRHEWKLKSELSTKPV